MLPGTGCVEVGAICVTLNRGEVCSEQTSKTQRNTASRARRAQSHSCILCELRIEATLHIVSDRCVPDRRSASHSCRGCDRIPSRETK
eukprot:6195674-Pleurochrysis_carterae.AAC.2